MDVDLRIKTEQSQGKVPVTVFYLHGWLDGQSEGQLVQAATDAHQQGARYLLLDMSELDMITSAGMRAIQKAFKLFTPQQEKDKPVGLKLCNATPKVYAILNMAGFLQHIPNYESTQTALDSFAP